MTNLDMGVIGAVPRTLSRRTEKAFLIAADLGALFISAYIGGLAKLMLVADRGVGALGPAGRVGQISLSAYIALAAAVIAIFWYSGHYSQRRPFWDDLQEIIHILAIAALANAALLYLAKADFSRSWFLVTWILNLALIPVLRVSVKRALIRAGRWQVPTIIIGAGPNAVEAAAALESEPLMGNFVTAFVSPTAFAPAGSLAVGGRQVPVVAAGSRISEQLRRFDGGKTHVVVALEHEDISHYQRLVRDLHCRFGAVTVVPPLRGLPLYGMHIHHFFRHEAIFLQSRNNLSRRGARILKRVFDFSGALVLILLLSPLFALLIWKVSRTGSPIFYGHTRVGQGKRHFKCYKFRSMVPNADQVLKELLENDPEARAEWERDYKLKNDPRITAVGAFLRRTSLDELPQLWNVLKGEMSLVGPRPIVDGELDRYEEDLEYYLGVHPGMSGLWQISGRNDTDYKNRVYLDAWYVKNWSLWYDIVILLKTVRVVFAKSGAY